MIILYTIIFGKTFRTLNWNRAKDHHQQGHFCWRRVSNGHAPADAKSMSLCSFGRSLPLIARISGHFSINLHIHIFFLKCNLKLTLGHVMSFIILLSHSFFWVVFSVGNIFARKESPDSESFVGSNVGIAVPSSQDVQLLQDSKNMSFSVILVELRHRLQTKTRKENPVTWAGTWITNPNSLYLSVYPCPSKDEPTSLFQDFIIRFICFAFQLLWNRI